MKDFLVAIGTGMLHEANKQADSVKAGGTVGARFHVPRKLDHAGLGVFYEETPLHG